MKGLDTSQVEQLKQIGESLAKTRHERGTPLEEVAMKTFIPLRLLQALEQGQVDRLPEAVFIQGFIRRYADLLGLDGMAISKTFVINPSIVPTNSSPTNSSSSTGSGLTGSGLTRAGSTVPNSGSNLSANSTRMSAAATTPTTPTTPTNTKGSVPVTVRTTPPAEPVSSADSTWKPAERSSLIEPSRQERPNLPISPIALLAGLAVVLGLGALSLLNRHQPSAQPSPSPSVAATTPPKPSPTLVSDAPIQVVVELTGESWMQIRVDGKSVFEGMGKKGYRKTWTAQKSLTVQAGNAGAVQVSYNQGQPKLMGKPGEVRDITFPNSDQTPQP